MSPLMLYQGPSGLGRWRVPRAHPRVEIMNNPPRPLFSAAGRDESVLNVYSPDDVGSR
jgi:hypothetical protein